MTMFCGRFSSDFRDLNGQHNPSTGESLINSTPLKLQFLGISLENTQPWKSTLTILFSQFVCSFAFISASQSISKHFPCVLDVYGIVFCSKPNDSITENTCFTIENGKNWAFDHFGSEFGWHPMFERGYGMSQVTQNRQKHAQSTYLQEYLRARSAIWLGIFRQSYDDSCHFF